MTRGETLIEACRSYAELEGATCAGMIAMIERFLKDTAYSGRLALVMQEIQRAKEESRIRRSTGLTQADLLIVEKAVESMEKLGYAYTYTLGVAMYFRKRGFQVDKTEGKVSFVIREPEEVDVDE